MKISDQLYDKINYIAKEYGDQFEEELFQEIQELIESIEIKEIDVTLLHQQALILESQSLLQNKGQRAKENYRKMNLAKSIRKTAKYFSNYQKKAHE